MRGQLRQQATAILGQSALVISTERVDDVALLIGQRVTMGLPEVLDRPLPRHWTQRRISWGWTAVMWLASILTEGDHRNVSMDTSLKGMHHTRRHLTAQVIAPLDWRDDRLSHRLAHVRKPASWHQIEGEGHARSIAVYAWSQDVRRCEATTVSGAQWPEERGSDAAPEHSDDGLVGPLGDAAVDGWVVWGTRR